MCSRALITIPCRQELNALPPLGLLVLFLTSLKIVYVYRLKLVSYADFWQDNMTMMPRYQSMKFTGVCFMSQTITILCAQNGEKMLHTQAGCQNTRKVSIFRV